MGVDAEPVFDPLGPPLDWDGIAKLRGKHYALARQYGLAGNHQLAVEEFTKAIQEYPNDSELYTDRGYALAQVKRYHEALSDAETYFKLVNQKVSDPTDFAPAYRLRAIAYAGLGRLEEAVEDYKRAIEFDSNDYEAKRELAEVYARQGRTQLALEQFYAVRKIYSQWNKNLIFQDKQRLLITEVDHHIKELESKK